MSQALQEIVRHAERQYKRVLPHDMILTLRVHAETSADDLAIRGEVLRVRNGAAILNTYRATSEPICMRHFSTLMKRGDGAMIDEVRGIVKRLLDKLVPPPLPRFRIDTKPHPKRLLAQQDWR